MFSFPMLSSAKHQRNHRVSAPNKNKKLTKVSSISSSSSSSSSSPSPSSSSSTLPSQDSQLQKRSLVTMDEVWKDINPASNHHLNRHNQHPQHNHEPRFRSHNHQNQNPNSHFQDFLNRPLNREPTPTSLTMSSTSNGNTNTVTALFSSPLPPPATVLSLNSGADFEFLDNVDSNLHIHRHLSSNVTAFNNPFETCFGKRRGQETNEGSGNRRHKRMIKNRESAARSRARKQAYTNELQLEIAHLQAENARLKREQDQLRMAAAIQQPKKKKLQRALTAPF